MTSFVCRYPDGPPGIALLLIRVSLAVVAFGLATVLGAGSGNPLIYYLGAAFLALLLAVGFASRSAALLLGLSLAGAMSMSGQLQQLLLIAGHVGTCVATMLLGPGAFSIDARRHGRRVIHLQGKAPDRGAED